MQSQMQHQHHSPQPNSHHNYPSSQQQKHDSSSSASASSYQVKLELASSGASYQNANGRFSPSPANGRFSPSPAPPQNNPGFGRAFSHESALQQQPGQGQSQGQQSLQFSPQLYLKQELLSYKQEQAYFSDGGVDPSYVQVTSGPRSTAAFNAQYNVPSSAGGSPRGSHSLPHGFGRTLGTRRDSHEEHKHTAAAASNASSGSATPLHGPGPIRGCNSMGDLPRLLMLHAQNSQPSTLLPLCPSGSTTASIGSSSHSSHHHPHSSGSSGSSSSAASAMHAERIGAYSREERAKRLARYHDKRSRRCWSKRVLYACRKVFADGRKRVGGRFIKKQHPGCPCPDLCLPGCVNYVEPAESGATAPSSSGTTKATSSPPRSSRKK
jgi:hypothetical protein